MYNLRLFCIIEVTIISITIFGIIDSTINFYNKVSLLAINDHFVSKYESTLRFHQKKHKIDEQTVLTFQEWTVPESRKTKCAQTDNVS